MEWKTPEYSKNQINKAGKVLKNPSSKKEEKAKALLVIDNWRASHAFPLHIIYCYFRRNYGSKYIVAQRLKRLDSIIKKLKREPNMSLWTMQDLGGCRIIVSSISEVYRVAKKYKASRVRHILKREYDYIENPKHSGYRSYHMIYEYKSDTKETYNRNMLVEIQIRTRLQHLWATAIETVGLFTKQALKASHGEKDTLRFFALISSLFALEERQPTIPGTPTEKQKIIEEIIVLDKKNNYLEMLSAIRVAVGKLDKKYSDKKGYYILILNYVEKRLSFKFYYPSQIDKAIKKYNQIENTRESNQIDAVLVSVSSFKSLKAAYPNYFSNIKDFVKTMKKAITHNI